MKLIKAFGIIFLIGNLFGCYSQKAEGNNLENKQTEAIKQSNQNAKKVEISNSTKTPSNNVPNFKKNEDYQKSVREKLLKAGWIPARSEEGKENCVARGKTCEDFPELEAGPSSPLGQAILRWQKGDKILLIHAIDSFLFDSYEFEKPKKAISNTNFEGKYIYSSKHEYGEDRYILELKPDNFATYISEVEGGDGFDLKGEWEIDEATNEIIVSFPNAQNGTETYVFKVIGKELKMIKEPKLPKGTVGFTGTIFKKQ